jgi:hypothetical protein
MVGYLILFTWCFGIAFIGIRSIAKRRRRHANSERLIESGILCGFNTLDNETRLEIWANKYGPMKIKERGFCFDNEMLLLKGKKANSSKKQGVVILLKPKKSKGA